MWRDGGPMAHKKAELEIKFFTGSDFLGNIYGNNSYPERVHVSVSRGKKRRPTSNAPNNESKESLEVVVRRISKLLNKENEFGVRSGNQTYTDLVLDTFVKMDIKSNHDLNVALNKTRDSP